LASFIVLSFFCSHSFNVASFTIYFILFLVLYFSEELREEQFQLLCPDGSRRLPREFLECNWGRIPNDAIMTSSAKTIEERQKYQAQLEVGCVVILLVLTRYFVSVLPLPGTRGLTLKMSRENLKRTFQI